MNLTENQKKKWSAEQASEWYKNHQWIVGCNFIPSTAVNQLEMWQKETFDPETIRNELKLAHNLGFNSIRVYLHDIVWTYDSDGLFKRMNHFLDVSDNSGISVVFVLFDDCHRPSPKAGKQSLPVFGVHNSGWQQSPGENILKQFHNKTVSAEEKSRLKSYIKSVLKHFADDSRILMWDIYNEPGQEGKFDESFKLLSKTWEWAREVDIEQPMTSCIYGSEGEKNINLNSNMSDILTFHCYEISKLEKIILDLKRKAETRPIICTEYMAREHGTTFRNSLPIFKKHNIGCFNWGLVAGKTQTYFNWETVSKLEERKNNHKFVYSNHKIPEPSTWHHDIFRKNGTPYDKKEVKFIQKILKNT